MSEEIKIEKGIPIPFGTRNQNPLTLAISQMDVGDSVVAPTTYIWPNQIAAQANKRLAPKRFKSKKTDAGYRVWRTA